MKKVPILMVLFVVLVSGCATTQVQVRKPVHFGKHPLYAKLDKVDGKYVITEISNKTGDHGLWFVLNDLTPLFDTRYAKCVFWKPWSEIKMYLQEGDPQKCLNVENTFRKLHYIYQEYHLKNYLGAGFLVYYKSIFNERAYYKAVEEALRNSNINRQQLLAEYDAFINSANKLRDQYSNEYENYLKNNIKFMHQIKDESGLYKNDIYNFSSLYSIHKNRIPKISEVIVVKFSPKQIGSYKASFNNSLKEYEETLKKATSNYELTYSTPKQVKGYNIEISAPSVIPHKKGETQNVTIVFTILSKDFKNIYPKYTNEDDALRIEFDRENIRFFNKTNNFLQIKNISIYYNNEISNFKFGDNALELPPKSTNKQPLSIQTIASPEIANMSNYQNITKDIALQQNISFGFAIKYRLIEQNIDRTLYKEKKYNLYNVISNL